MATLIKTDGTKREFEPQNGRNFQLRELYELLSCSQVQIIELSNNQLMIMDEEGLFKDPVIMNKEATLLARDVLFDGDCIVGDALVCESHQFI